MPKFLEKKLKAEYGNNPAAIYGTMNKLGYMKGNKETAKGKAAEKKHNSRSSYNTKSTAKSSWGKKSYWHGIHKWDRKIDSRIILYRSRDVIFNNQKKPWLKKTKNTTIKFLPLQRAV